MKKIFSYIFIGISMIIGISIPEKASAQCWRGDQNQPMSQSITYEQCEQLRLSGSDVFWVEGPPTEASVEAEAQVNPVRNSGTPGFWESILNGFFAQIVSWILSFVSLLTGLAGGLLNGIIYYTIVKISDNYNNLTPIQEAWKVIRDISNMAFIFVLLYASIKTILGQGSDTKKLIINVVVVAAVINFSMFFTRVIIDTSNIVALQFYSGVVKGPSDDLGASILRATHLESLYGPSTTGGGAQALLGQARDKTNQLRVEKIKCLWPRVLNFVATLALPKKGAQKQLPRGGGRSRNRKLALLVFAPSYLGEPKETEFC